MTPEVPRRATRTLARPLAVVAILAALAIFGATGAGGLIHPVTPVVAVDGARTSAVTTDRTQLEALKLAIQRSNEAQARAFNGGDASLMRENATASFYTDLVKTNRDLQAAGVTKIDLVATDWGDITVDGTTAKATTFETWRSTYRDGSSDEQTARNDYTLVLQAGAWKVDADEQPSAVLQPAPQATDTGTPAAAAAKFSTSSNWSGYGATGGTFTSVTATWTVPTVSPTVTGADATWVGIGGIDSRDLIQAGTQATVSGGEVAYEAWVEMLPAASRPVSLSVNAGDSVTVTVAQKSPGEWTITMKNNTTGGRYATTVQYASTNSSAEWVQEAPSVGRGTVPLDAFGTLRFTGASAVRDGKTLDLTELGAEAITMINGARQPLAVPSVIGADGASFSVTRTEAQNTTAADQRRRRG
jgi:hypothetical protein